MSKNDMVMVPRELLERLKNASSYLGTHIEASEGIKTSHYANADAARELLAQPAQQHQGEPVALPARKDENSVSGVYGYSSGWNACLDEIAKLGPLYSRPVQGEPVAWCQPHWSGKYADYCWGSERPNSPCPEMWKPLYTHPAPANTAEVERLRAELKHLLHSSVKEEVFDIVCKERDTLRAQLAEAQALLRDKSGDLIRMAAHLISAPLFALQDLQDEDKKMTRARVDHAVDVADARLKDAAYELRQIANTLSASAEPSAPECKCDMRTKLVGDGCATCNPERAADLMEPSALVEIDERAEFDAWFKDHSKDWPFPSESIKCIARDNDWLVWQARAALARKP